MISHLNGGNLPWPFTTTEAYMASTGIDWSGCGWDGVTAEPLSPAVCRPGQLHQRFPFAVARPVVCPRCGDRMREVAGFDDYCPTCRMQEELAIEREAVATGYLQPERWGDWDAQDDAGVVADRGHESPCGHSPTAAPDAPGAAADSL